MANPTAKRSETFRDNSKKKDVRTTNIEAAKAVADAVRTSLGPRGMDKMVGALRRSVHESCLIER